MSEEYFIDLRYEDKLALENRMLHFRKKAREARGTKEEVRTQAQMDIATLQHDIAYLLQENRIMREMLEICDQWLNRIIVLEKLIAKEVK